MKALTLWQPWASLVTAKIKWLETRSWQIDYRGPLAIHAAKAYPRAARELAATPAFRWGLHRCDPDLPRGCVLCTVELVAIYPVEELIGDARQLELPGNFQAPDFATQFCFGDFSPGRFAWHFKNITPLATPAPAKGGQRIWEWEKSHV